MFLKIQELKIEHKINTLQIMNGDNFLKGTNLSRDVRRYALSPHTSVYTTHINAWIDKSPSNEFINS